MIDLIKNWFNNNFSNPQAATLTIVILLIALLIYLFGSLLSPVLAAIIIAYLLNGIVNKITSLKLLPTKLILPLVFLVFLAFIVFIIIIILPAVMSQLSNFVSKVPSYMTLVQAEINNQITTRPELFNQTIIDNIYNNFSKIITKFSQNTVSQFFSLLPNLITALIYFIMIPMLTWFLLSDKNKMMIMLNSLVPNDHSLTKQVWHDVDEQLGNYIRGKIIEIGIVGAATYVAFLIFDLQFALLLAVLVGFSVLIPYIGATVVSIPVVLVAYSQFGISQDLAYVLLIFFILQALDAYVLVPVLFAQAINMHPVAIIVAILFFGGLWGFWGLFFAIPLAVLIQVVILVWPTTKT